VCVTETNGNSTLPFALPSIQAPFAGDADEGAQLQSGCNGAMLQRVQLGLNGVEL